MVVVFPLYNFCNQGGAQSIVKQSYSKYYVLSVTHMISSDTKELLFCSTHSFTFPMVGPLMKQ